MNSILNRMIGPLLLGAVPCIAFSEEQYSYKAKEPERARQAVRLWQVFVEKQIKVGDSLDKVKKVMQPKSKDWGTSYPGGTGRYDVIFKVDDFIQVAFLVDRADKVLAIGVDCKRADWIKDPDGLILQELSR